MKFSFKFSNLLGTVYHKGNLVFTNDGNGIISPVGNKLNIFNLKDNKSEALPIESSYSIVCVALSPCGRVVLTVNEDNQILVCSLISRTVLYSHHFPQKINYISYSPDGKYVAVAQGNAVYLYHAPGTSLRQLHSFQSIRIFKGFYDDVLYISWSSDSQVLSACSKDMTTRTFTVKPMKNFHPFCLGGHADIVVSCFFEDNSLDLYTVSRNGTVIVWEAALGLEDLVTADKANDEPAKKKRRGSKVEEEETKMPVLLYKKVDKHMPRNLIQVTEKEYITLTASAFHPKTHFLITGFSNGAFFLHEMPEFNMIHSLSIADQCISTICFNCTGDWIGLACANVGQLIVWEWQSETFIMKQQGHFNNMSCVVFSPDGQFLVTGGEDGKVKVWNVVSGFCFVTFDDHASGITAVSFGKNGKVVVSASLDGTVRAFDLNRYRNFKTFTSPRPSQFASLALDPSGEIVCAGGQDVFEIFVWSMQTGRLLDVLSGHKAPVGGLSFSPSAAILISASWDKTVRIWDVFESKNNREALDVLSDALTTTFRPDGKEFAVATINGYITFFNLQHLVQCGSIEGRNDLDSGRRDTDLVTAKQVLKGKAFTTLCYTADGECILAAGQSKNVCIYHVRQQILLKKFEISQNRSFDAVDDLINRRKMTEFGNIALVEDRDPDFGGEVSIALPGVRKGDMASRAFKPEVRVSCIRFSPTGRLWSAATTEGLLIYSLDDNVVFDPLDLETEVTTSSVHQGVLAKDHLKALMMALKLKEHKLVAEVVESVPPEEVKLVMCSLPDRYVERFVAFLGRQLESSRHVEFYLMWAETLLMNHGQRLKDRSMQIIPHLHALHRTLIMKRQNLEKICDFNKFTLKYVVSLGGTLQRKKATAANEASESEDDEREVLFQDDSDDMEQD